MLQTVNMNNDPFRVGSGASTATTSRRRGPSPSSTFPAKLFKILSDPENSHIITWMPHGRSWRMLQPTLFSEKVAPKYFSHQSKYSSFMRQVNGWGFKRITRGPDRNSYYHELFIRDEPQLARTMSRRSSGSDKSSKGDADDIEPPNFYEMTGTPANPPGHMHSAHSSHGMNPHNPSGGPHAHSAARHGHPPHGGGAGARHNSGLLSDDPHQQHPAAHNTGGHPQQYSAHGPHGGPGSDLSPAIAYDSMAYYSQQGYGSGAGYNQHQVYPPPWAAYPLPSYPYQSHPPPDMGAPTAGAPSGSASVSSAMRNTNVPPSNSVNEYPHSSSPVGAATPPGGRTSSGEMPPPQYPGSHHDAGPWGYGYGQPYGPPHTAQGPGQGYNYYPSYPPHPPSSFSGGGGYDSSVPVGGSGPLPSGPGGDGNPTPHYGGDYSQQHQSHHSPVSSPHNMGQGTPSNQADGSGSKFFDSSRIEGGSGGGNVDHVPAIKEEVGAGRGPSPNLLSQQRQSSSQELNQRPSDAGDATGKLSFKNEHPYDQLF